MRRVILIMLLCTPLCGKASHIVGGEFELLHISGFEYRLNLILYFDKLNGLPGAKDQGASVNFFSKKNNTIVMTQFINLISELSVGYTQPECSSGEIVTDKLIYTALVYLDPLIFTDPEGYYVAWQRCCRNYTITNIFSQNPASGGFVAGQTFYLEFPAVVKDGTAFINSSPRLFPPLNDYACPNKPYYVDFTGLDDDGDSLVYTMVEPLNTHAATALPPPLPAAPYPSVQWRQGYGLNNIINGAPDLRISPDGLLTATPVSQGLFVFAVKIDEYRDGLKIGESRRDFQMLVVDRCTDADPPVIMGKKLNDVDFTFVDNMSVTFANTLTDEERCIKVRVSDSDSQKPQDDFRENIQIRAVSLNFRKNVSEILPPDVTETLIDGSTTEFTICFPACPYFEGGAYQIGIIAMDDACALPLLDTLKVTVNIDAPANSDPYFLTGTQIFHTLNEGDQASWIFEARDDDLDELLVSFTNNGFVFANAGMTMTILEQEPGYVKGQLNWDAYCALYNFTQRNYFEVNIIAEDVDQCGFNNAPLAKYTLVVILPGNADPIIDTNLTPHPLERTIALTRKVNETLIFNVTGSDLVDNDFLVLDVIPMGFKLFDHGVLFPKVEGNSSLLSQFKWDIGCGMVDLTKKDVFDFRFIVVDNSNKCRFYKADTVDVKVTVLPPDNSDPLLIVTSMNPEHTIVNGELEVFQGQPIELSVVGTDADDLPEKDHLRLTLIEAEGNLPPVGYEFSEAEGSGSISTTFKWNPECNIFKNKVYKNEYTFTFKLVDDRCFSASADTVRLNIIVRDYEHGPIEFDPINVFTPNDDGINDFYSMDIIDSETGKMINLFPPDNCLGQFQAIRIYNRWGNQVFESNDRHFKWYGKGEAAGVYYYVVTYTTREYKGALSIRY